MPAGDREAEAELRLPHPSKRTKQQHLFAAYLMRPRKAMMTPRRAKQQTEEQAGHAMALIRDSGVLLNRRAKNTQVKGVVSIVGVDSCRLNHHQCGPHTTNSQSRRGEDIRQRFIVGHSGLHAWLLHMPLAPVTQETLTLHLILFIDSSIARSNGQILV